MADAFHTLANSSDETKKDVLEDFKGISLSDDDCMWEEAKAYIEHPVLGARLREITQALLDLPEGADLHEVFGFIDAKKVRSCMTLFHLASGEQLFMDVLNRYCGGQYSYLTAKEMES